MKKILIIGTGGTIASVPTENGLTPGLTGQDLIRCLPGTDALCDIDFVQPFSLDSTNIRPAHWILLAQTIRKSYDAYDGFVVTHGTDTLAYTAAGLSYLIQNSPKPVILTGSQKPMEEDGTDAKRNLLDALLFACDDGSHGVYVVFSGAVICGTRARKNYSKRFMAFGSINFPQTAHIENGRIIRYLADEYSADGPVFYDFLNPNVGLLKLTPGINNDVMRYTIERYDGLIVESFGVGGLPEYSDFSSQIRNAADQGKCIVMTTQVPNEGSDLSVYRTGNSLKKDKRVLEAHDMTTEAALAKLMWVLGQTDDFEEAARLFYRPIHHDILWY